MSSSPGSLSSTLCQGFRWPSNDAVCFIHACGPGEHIYWLLNGGDVASSDVVVLSFYQRQVREIRTFLKQRTLRIRELTSMDGFQGSEAPVVIISTVRCNASGHTGFAGDRVSVVGQLHLAAVSPTETRWAPLYSMLEGGTVTWQTYTVLLCVGHWIAPL